MTTFLRRILVGVTVLLITGVFVPWRAYGAVRGAGVPSGSVVLRQAATEMQRSLRAVHTEGQVQLRVSGQIARSHISGDCVMTSRSQADRFQSRGTTVVNGRLQSNKVQYISVQSHTWRRIGTGPWQHADSDQGALISLDLCPAFFLFQPGMASLVPGARNRGTITVGRRKVWHITLHSVFLGMDVYVDQQTHYWLRMVSDAPGPPQQHAVFNYSAFNHSVSITRPRQHTMNATTPLR